MKIRFRLPKIRVTRKGKVDLVQGGLSLGGKNGRINLSRSGLNTTVGGPGMNYNTKRGWLLNPLGWLRQLRKK